MGEKHPLTIHLDRPRHMPLISLLQLARDRHALLACLLAECRCAATPRGCPLGVVGVLSHFRGLKGADDGDLFAVDQHLWCAAEPARQPPGEPAAYLGLKVGGISVVAHGAMIT